MIEIARQDVRFDLEPIMHNDATKRDLSICCNARVKGNDVLILAQHVHQPPAGAQKDTRDMVRKFQVEAEKFVPATDKKVQNPFSRSSSPCTRTTVDARNKVLLLESTATANSTVEERKRFSTEIPADRIYCLIFLGMTTPRTGYEARKFSWKKKLAGPVVASRQQ